MCDDPDDEPDGELDDALDDDLGDDLDAEPDVTPPRIFNWTDLYGFECPRCGTTGCRECAARREDEELLGITRREDLAEINEYGSRLDYGFALLAEGDDSLLDD